MIIWHGTNSHRSKEGDIIGLALPLCHLDGRRGRTRSTITSRWSACRSISTPLTIVHPLQSQLSRLWWPDGYSRIFRLYVFGPLGFWTMAPLRCAAKFDPFLSFDCAPMPSTLAQSKEGKGSNFAIWQPWADSAEHDTSTHWTCGQNHFPAKFCSMCLFDTERKSKIPENSDSKSFL